MHILIFLATFLDLSDTN